MLTLDENWLVSWWDVERFAADHFCAVAAWIEQQAAWYRDNGGKSPGANPTWNQCQALQQKLDDLALQCKAIGLRNSTDSIAALRDKLSPKPWGLTYERVGWHLSELAEGIQREMKRTLFLYVPQERSEFYESPLEKWQDVIKRFSRISTDIEEGCKCFAQIAIQMTDNEKAAIAAGLWEPRQREQCQMGPPCSHESHPIPCPDMHDPANLWRALETLLAREWIVSLWRHTVMMARAGSPDAFIRRDSMFAALVALYDDEHKSSPKH